MRFMLSALAGLLILAAPVAAAAQEADDRAHRLALAERAIEAMQGEQLADQMTQIMQAFPGPETAGMSGEERIIFDEVMADTMDWMMSAMLERMSSLYADIYTTEELQALVDFYESPVGQSVMRKSLEATPQIIEMTRALIPETMRRTINGLCDRFECSPEERRQAIADAMASMGLRES
ncbi:DUF2059 domain-containing protein [Brevundimonas sp.]|uniref:DUF2059 domain-containing protein n=1 Tax=Brevundimonas sp. TaxID=1871086 RepID=UPI0025DF6668|nr:DUF2059 domain-containing protein [Brevundimonas sp.]